MFLQVKCVFVEIYNDEIKDLFYLDMLLKVILICEDVNGDIIFVGVWEEEVINFKSMIRYLYLFWWQGLIEVL